VGIELTKVVRVHRMGEVAVTALRGVSLSITPGEFIAIMGPSGCGKSTLLSLLGGLDRPTQGTIVAGGRKLNEMRDRQLADYRLQHVGTIFQSFNLIPTMSALDNVALPMTLGGVPAAQRRERSRRLLEKVGLKDRVNFRPTRLSGGEQQRVSVARALANRPGLILADEPTGNLDEEADQGVLHWIKAMHGLVGTAVMVPHDPERAALAGTGQLNQVSVGENGFGLSDPTKHQPLDAAALARMAALPHVKDAYGNLEIQGTLGGGQSDLSNVYLTSFTPLAETPQALS